MARAKRHYIPGQIWHITHRCHKRESPVMGVLARGRESIKVGDSYQLREPPVPYRALFGGKKDDIGLDNTWLWDV
jgi:hypothetical protein